MITFVLTLAVTLMAVLGLSLGLVLRGRSLQGGCSPKECTCRNSGPSDQPIRRQCLRKIETTDTPVGETP